MSTPKLSTAIRSRVERRDRQAQTAFPAKVIGWKQATGVVELEPQFVETWVNRDGTRESEVGIATITNVPVCYPRSGDWSITFPIEPGSFGLVICTKYSLDQWRQQGDRIDPGDLRRFTMSGATFHPVNLHPDSSALSNVNTSFMILSQGGTVDFVALKKDVDDIKTMIDQIKTQYNSHSHTATGCLGAAGAPLVTASYTVTASSKVKVE